MVILAQPKGLNPWHRGHKFHIFGKGFHGNHNIVFSFSAWDPRDGLVIKLSIKITLIGMFQNKNGNKWFCFSQEVKM